MDPKLKEAIDDLTKEINSFGRFIFMSFACQATMLIFKLVFGFEFAVLAGIAMLLTVAYEK